MQGSHNPTVKMIVEVKKSLGPLEMEAVPMAELLLQAHYVFQGVNSFEIEDCCIFCLCDFMNFHYFKLVPATMMQLCSYMYMFVMQAAPHRECPTTRSGGLLARQIWCPTCLHRISAAHDAAGQHSEGHSHLYETGMTIESLVLS